MSNAINVNIDIGKVSQGWIDVRKALKILIFFGEFGSNLFLNWQNLKILFLLPQSSRSKH